MAFLVFVLDVVFVESDTGYDLTRLTRLYCAKALGELIRRITSFLCSLHQFYLLFLFIFLCNFRWERDRCLIKFIEHD